VLELARLGVATRPGVAHDRLDAVVAQLSRPGRVELFELDPLPLSSSELRDRVARGEPIDQFVPPSVGAEIQRRGLYRPRAWVH
jgi:nicotinate-nucleotide adenylyltransferase